MAVAVVLMVGCSAQQDEVESVDLAASEEAVDVVAATYGIDAEAVTVTWVTSPMAADDGTPVRGKAYGCDLYVSWWNSSWTSGYSADGPAVSSTALAHEMAHCALSLEGDSDHDHKRVEWWGANGRVAQATRQLTIAGM